MTKEIAWKVAKRAALEFGPPLLFGIWWMYLNWASGKTTADWVAHFSAGFVVPAWVWSNLLRIHYQQSTRIQQTNMEGTVRILGTDVTSVKNTLAILTPKIEAVLPNLAPNEAREITDLVETANTQIATANSNALELQTIYDASKAFYIPITLTERSNK